VAWVEEVQAGGDDMGTVIAPVQSGLPWLTLFFLLFFNGSGGAYTSNYSTSSFFVVGFFQDRVS
jgi:hypothetical protein